MLDESWIADEDVHKRRFEHPPIWPSISKGSLLIRGIRSWHAGIANETQNPRIMLAIVLPQKSWINDSTIFQSYGTETR